MLYIFLAVKRKKLTNLADRAMQRAMSDTDRHIYILRVDCPDQPGLVAAVAGCLFAQGCNIEEAAQFNDKFSGRFFMRVVFSAPAVQGFRDEFAKIATQHAMGWDIHRADEKVPALLMVSKADHCLNDILYRVRTDHLPLSITAVVSNHEACRTLVEHHGLRFIHMPVTPATKATQEEALRQLVEQTGSELIVLARYMQVLSADMCAAYPGRIINIHHSFLPGFKGAKPYHQAWERGVKIIGATAHFVTSDLDEGPIIVQQTQGIDHTLTPEALQVLGRDIEAQVLSRALQSYAERRVFLQGNRTVIL